MNWCRYRSYVGQLDHQYSVLTVKEVIEYSNQCSNGTVYSNYSSNLKKLYNENPELVIKILGLNNCKNTIVGNSQKRGLSGGEIRRLCLAEMLLGDYRVMIFDKISTGLDSAVTHDIIEYLTLLCKSLKTILICCLLQPEPSTILLFDNLILLEKGYVIYNGPTNKCEEYFLSLGYERPETKDLGSYLIDIASENGREKYRINSVGNSNYQSDDDLDDQVSISQSLTNQSSINQSSINQSLTSQSLTNQSSINQSLTNQSLTNQSSINQSSINQSNNQSINNSPIPTAREMNELFLHKSERESQNRLTVPTSQSISPNNIIAVSTRYFNHNNSLSSTKHVISNDILKEEEEEEDNVLTRNNSDSLTVVLSQMYNDKYYDSKYPRSIISLFGILLAKQWKLLTRNSLFSTARIAQAIIMGLLFGWIFFGVINNNINRLIVIIIL